MENAQKALLMAAGLFLTIALITIGVVMFMSAQDATKKTQDSFTGMQNDLSQSEFTIYDETIITGSQVVDALKRYEYIDAFSIGVKSGANNEFLWYGTSTTASDILDKMIDETAKGSDGTIKDIKKKGADDYINPSGRFKAYVLVDENDMVAGLAFKQIVSKE